MNTDTAVLEAVSKTKIQKARTTGPHSFHQVSYPCQNVEGVESKCQETNHRCRSEVQATPPEQSRLAAPCSGQPPPSSTVWQLPPRKVRNEPRSRWSKRQRGCLGFYLSGSLQPLLNFEVHCCTPLISLTTTTTDTPAYYYELHVTH